MWASVLAGDETRTLIPNTQNYRNGGGSSSKRLIIQHSETTPSLQEYEADIA
jgi:hypothetical protein